MPKLHLQPHLTPEQIKQRMVAQKQLRLHKYWQVIHALAIDPHKKSHEIAAVLGNTASNVQRIVKLYNTLGADFDQGLQWGGRRLANSFMSLDEEAIMMKNLQAKALKGAILTFRDIKQAVEKKLCGQVSGDYIWDLFRRHGWSKKAPGQNTLPRTWRRKSSLKKTSKAPGSQLWGSKGQKTHQAVL